MKKYILVLVLSVFCTLFSFADTVITMEFSNGVYKIPCLVNGARMKMVFDTGASTVSLSLSMAQYLYDNDYLVESDFGEAGKSQMADGRIVNHVTVNIRDFEIGGLHIDNVKAIVTANQEAPLLMGQSVIQRLGRVTIDGDKLIILDHSVELSDEDIDELDAIAKEAMDNCEYIKAKDAYARLYQNDVLTDYGIFKYADACQYSEDYKTALSLYLKLKPTKYGTAEGYNPVSMLINLYTQIAYCYLKLNEEGLGNAYIEKAVDLVPSEFKEKNYKVKPCEVKSAIYANFASSYDMMEKYSNACSYNWKALQEQAKKFNLTAQNIWNICIGNRQNSKVSNDDTVQMLAARYAIRKWMAYQLSDDEFGQIIKRMARLGNETAKVFCNENDIKY